MFRATRSGAVTGASFWPRPGTSRTGATLLICFFSGRHPESAPYALPKIPNFRLEHALVVGRQVDRDIVLGIQHAAGRQHAKQGPVYAERGLRLHPHNRRLEAANGLVTQRKRDKGPLRRVGIRQRGLGVRPADLRHRSPSFHAACIVAANSSCHWRPRRKPDRGADGNKQDGTKSS